MADVSFYEGTDTVMKRCLGLTGGKKLKNKSTSRNIKCITGKGGAKALLDGMYNTMTCKSGINPTRSSENWRRERQIECLADHNKKPETRLEKAVAMLANNDHMPGWCNQVPTASGITGPAQDKKANVDLVHWCSETACLRLIELKWKSDTPLYALFEILKYALSYIFFRSREISPCALIDLRPRRVALEIVAPQEFFDGHDQRALLREISDAITPFAASKIRNDPPVMSVDMLAFPSDFRLPFQNGAEVQAQCGTEKLTPEGRRVCDAFANLSPVLT